MLVNYNYEDLIEVYVNPDLWIGTTDNGDVNQDIRFGRNYLFSKIFLSDLVDDIGLIQPIDLLIKDHISSEKINKLTYALDYSGKGITEGLVISQITNDIIEISKGVAVVDNCVIKVKQNIQININDFSDQSYLKTGKYHIVLRYRFDRNNIHKKAYFDLIKKEEYENKLYKYDPTILSLGILYIIKEAKYSFSLNNAIAKESNKISNTCKTFDKDIIYIHSSYGLHGCIYPNGYIPVVKSDEIVTTDIYFNGEMVFDGQYYYQSLYSNCSDIISQYPITHFDGTLLYTGLNRFDSNRISCDFPLKPNTSITFTILPDNSYKIHELYIDNIIQDPTTYYIFTNIKNNRSIYVNFEPMDLYISASSIGPGGIDPSGIIKVKCGSDITFKLKPDPTIDTEKAYLKSLIVDNKEVNITSEYTFSNITKSHTIFAIYDSYDTRTYYTINIDSNGIDKGTITPYGSFETPELSSLSLNIISKNGYKIKSIIINNFKLDIGVKNYSYRINSITKNYNIYVEFEEDTEDFYYVNLVYNKDHIEIRDLDNKIIQDEQLKLLVHKDTTIRIIPKSQLYCINNVIYNSRKLGKITEVCISYNNSKYQTIEIISEINNSYSEIKEYEINVTYTEGGHVYPGVKRTYPIHSTVTYHFVPDKQYEIKNIKINGVSQGKLSSYTFTDIKQNYTIEAEFERSKKIVTIESNEGGKVEPYGDIPVYMGEELLINITPLEGYYIKEIICNNNRIPPQSQYVLKDIYEDRYVYIYFDKKHYIIYVNSKGKGSVYPNQNIIIEHGDSIEFKFTPQIGHRIKNVIVDGINRGNLNLFQFDYVSQNHTLIVEFEPDTYEIDITYSEGGIVSPSGKIVVSNGSRQKIYIYPDKDYIIDSVQIDDQSLSNINTYEFVNIRENHKVHVTFKKKPENYKITVVANKGGVVDPIGILDIPQGGTLKIKIKANEDHIISKIIDNNNEQSINNNKEFVYTLDNINENHIVNIIFSTE